MRLMLSISTALMLAASSLLSQEARFFQGSSTQATTIVDFKHNGLLTLSNAAASANCRVDWATEMAGPWATAPVHAVVAQSGGAATILIPTTSTNCPPDLLERDDIWAHDRATIACGEGTYQLDVFLWRDFMPGPDPPPGLLGVIRVFETAGYPIPSSVQLGPVWLCHEGQVWVPPVVGEHRPQPDVIETTVRDGPYWPPGGVVKVRVLLLAEGLPHLLTTSDTIRETW